MSILSCPDCVHFDERVVALQARIAELETKVANQEAGLRASAELPFHLDRALARVSELEAAAIRNDERHAEAITAVRRRAEHAEARIESMKSTMRSAAKVLRENTSALIVDQIATTLDGATASVCTAPVRCGWCNGCKALEGRPVPLSDEDKAELARPIEEVDAELRSMGLDPEQVGKDGLAFVEKLKAQRPSVGTDPGVKCDACGNTVPRIKFRPLDGQGRCEECSERGVPYGHYLREQRASEAKSDAAREELSYIRQRKAEIAEAQRTDKARPPCETCGDVPCEHFWEMVESLDREITHPGLRGLCDNLEARAEKAEAMARDAMRQLAAIAEAVGNQNGEPEITLGIVREQTSDLERLSSQASRVVRAWEDDPTSIYTENAIKELNMRIPYEAGPVVEEPSPAVLRAAATAMAPSENMTPEGQRRFAAKQRELAELAKKAAQLKGPTASELADGAVRSMLREIAELRKIASAAIALADAIGRDERTDEEQEEIVRVVAEWRGKSTCGCVDVMSGQPGRDIDDRGCAIHGSQRSETAEPGSGSLAERFDTWVETHGRYEDRELWREVRIGLYDWLGLPSPTGSTER